MDKSELLALTQQGYDCAQCIVKEFEDVLGEDTGKVIRSVSAMSMGLLQGSICVRFWKYTPQRSMNFVKPSLSISA